ncbi:hypothetical protein SKUN_001671 [Spiroplasma kunkelii CR2-3x]|uniref:Uncharacterized protein n=1 Tax=Spiroplasma kunkelii CR2-3x TaxID=273035 RepID=A0A0K2JJA6_SPIKU|nr:hypothetical protein [Spiroplasma kunkelii]ALA98528.1 hypothetical protein SKUN_001671 [Spiroplasma kunkelii CR2-3x]
MGLWRLLGGEVNWERVAKMQNKEHLKEIHSSIIDALGGGTNNIPLSIDRLNDDDKNNVMWVLEKFGRSVPTTTKYPWLKPVDGIGNLHSRRFEYNQIRWNQAWEWYDEYKKGTIPFLEYRIQIREKELEEMEENLKHFKAKINKFGKNRTQIKLIKSYEEKIPLRKAEIAKLKSELESLKAKEIQTQPDLSLENENLRLKKEILEMELKLKEANKQR